PSGGNAGVLGFSLSADGNTAAVSFSPVTVQDNTRIALYRIPGGDLLNTFELTVDPQSPVYVETQALSPDGSLLCAVAGIFNGTTTMMMLDTATGAPIWTSDDHSFPVWSPDGTTLFTTGIPSFASTPNLEAMDARNGALKWTIAGGANTIRQLAVLADGALLA